MLSSADVQANGGYTQEQPLRFRALTQDGMPFTETYGDYQGQRYRQGSNAAKMMAPNSQPPQWRMDQPMPAPPPQDLEGTMANERDPFWMRRKYTREDSFPELKGVDLYGGPNMPKSETHVGREIARTMKSGYQPGYGRPSQHQQLPGRHMETVNPSYGNAHPSANVGPRLKSKPVDSGKHFPKYTTPAGSQRPYSNAPPYQFDEMARPSFESNNPSFLSRQARKQRNNRDNSPDGHHGSSGMLQQQPGGFPQVMQRQQVMPRPSGDASDMAILMSNQFATSPRGQLVQSRAIPSQQLPPPREYGSGYRGHHAAPPAQGNLPAPQPVQQYQPPNFANPYDNITRPLAPAQPTPGAPPPPPKIRSDRPPTARNAY